MQPNSQAYLAALSKRYGKEHMGRSSKELHPLTVKLMHAGDIFVEGNTVARDCYLQLIKSAAQDFQIPPPAAMESITPQKYKEFMQAYAAGVQYAAKKLGMPLDNIDFEFTHTLGIYDESYKDMQFLGAAIPELNKIALHPQVMMLGCINPTELGYPLLDGKFTYLEMATLIGAEEMIHMHQVAQSPDLKPTYDATYTEAEHAQDPAEQEARKIMAGMVKDLRIGSQHRGPRR